MKIKFTRYVKSTNRRNAFLSLKMFSHCEFDGFNFRGNVYEPTTIRGNLKHRQNDSIKFCHSIAEIATVSNVGDASALAVLS